MGPPPPGATRELGILAIQLLPKDIRLGGRFVNAREASLFTGVRRRGVLRSSDALFGCWDFFTKVV